MSRRRGSAWCRWKSSLTKTALSPLPSSKRLLWLGGPLSLCRIYTYGEGYRGQL